MKFKRFMFKLILIVMLLNCILPTQVVLADNEPISVNVNLLLNNVDNIPAQNPVWYSADLEREVNTTEGQYDDSIETRVTGLASGGAAITITHINREGDMPTQAKMDIGNNMVATQMPGNADYWYSTELTYKVLYNGVLHEGQLTEVTTAGVDGEGISYTFTFPTLNGSEADDIEASLGSGNDSLSVRYADKIEYRPNIDQEILDGEREFGTAPTLVTPTRTDGTPLYQPLQALRPATQPVDDKAVGLNPLEKMIAMLLNAIANAINKLIALAVGYRVTIDDIVFNNYSPVIVDFFDDLKRDNYSELIWGSSGNGSGGLSETINKTYSFFQKIAIVGYMIMLLYMGIRIMLASTGESLSQYKTLFMYWVIGVMILFLYPYVMKYTILLNNTFVDVIEANRFVGVGNQYSITPSTLPPTEITDETKSLIDVNFDTQPFNSDGSDYMSQIANDAQNGKRFAMALAYLVLTWQLITLIVHYYKRLFMVGFLIAIFPIVTLFYAVDRIADGKSQAFNKWNKEFMLNVLIQSFHAIVYVFVCGTVYSSYSSATGFDYILVITGVTFLFTGEEIIKKIFSQESPSGASSSLKDTAGQIAKTAIAVKAVKTVAKPFVGKDSVYNKVKDASANVKVADAKLGAFDAMARPVEAPNAGLRLDHAQSSMDAIDAMSISDEEKRAMKASNLRLANAIADLNNPNSRSAEELARARQIVDQARAENPNNELLQDLKLTADQMNDMQNIGNEVAHMVANGTFDTVSIDRHIQMRLGYTLEGMSEIEQDRYKNMLLTGLAFTGASRYDDPLESSRNEVEAGLSELESVMNSFTYRSRTDALDDADRERKRQIRADADAWAASFHEDGEEVTAEEKEVARSLFVIANRNSGLFTAEDYLDATSKIKSNAGSSEVAHQMAETLDVDADLLRHMMAHKVKEEGSGHYNRNRVRTILGTYESDLRDGVFDDELSGHELVALMFEHDDATREAKKQQIIDSMSEARRQSNLTERQYVRDIAADILAQNHVDITEGGMSEQRFLNGQTREQILEERRNAKMNVVKNLAGFGKTTSSGHFSSEYTDAMSTYQRHFMGDQPGDYDE